MGHKVDPRIFRIKITRGWNSKWFSNKKNYKYKLKQDIVIRDFLKKKLKEAAIDRIEFERSANSLTIIIHAAKPGLIIGRAGAGAEELKKEIQNRFLKKQMVPGQGKISLNLNIQEVSQPSLSAAIVMHGVITDIEKRIPFRRAIKQAIFRAEKAGAKGVKVKVGGRLDGVEIARNETLTSGRIPRHTFRADLDYAQDFARTLYGTIGVKVWIYRGEVFKNKEEKDVSSKKV